MIQTRNQSCVFNQTIYFPIHHLHSKRSLEISVWDKNIGATTTATATAAATSRTRSTSTWYDHHDQSNDEMKGKVIDTIEKGYYLNDKIIRHAKVVVGK